jgi:hypothetical protein
MFYSYEFSTYVGFSMVVLQQTLLLKVLVVFPNLETKELISSILILREMWPTFDKNPLIRLEV